MAWRAFKADRYDEALDILEHPREGGYEPKNVREKIRELLTKRPRILEKHLTLARLADLDADLDKERGRLVTTNFDHLFEKAAAKLRRKERSKHRMAVHIAPALPPAKLKDFRGLAYLHGKLGSSPDDRQLVLTTTDFGTAYMVEGWALRFVVGLFRNYHVVFVGYSVEDPMMRYLVTALDAEQETKKPYAFAPYSGENKQAEKLKWRLKGIKPLLYDKANEHRELWRVLKEWDEDYRRGITGRRYKVAHWGQSPPKDEDDPVVQDMAWALKYVEVARYFAELKDKRPRPGWIAHLQREGLLGLPIGRTCEGEAIDVPLVSQHLTDRLNLHNVTHELILWIVKSLDTQEALDWALREGGVLHADLREQIRFRLGNAKFEIRPAFRKIWQVLADDGYAHALSEKHQATHLLSVPRLAPDAVFAKQVFLNHLRPLPIFRVQPEWFGDRPEWLGGEQQSRDRPADWCEIEIELIGIQSKSEDVDRFRENAEDWGGALASMADELTIRLREAMSWLGEFDLATPAWDITYSGYPSISPHEQNRYAPTWTQLIKLTQESYDALIVADDNDAAARLVRRWRSLPYPVFRRLALYAATGAGMHDVKLGLEILLEGPQPALWGIHTQRETLRFLRKRGKDIPKKSLVCLIKEILKGPPRSLYSEGIEDDVLKNIRDQAIRLRFEKLMESGVELPDPYQEIDNRIPPLQSRSYPWKPLGNHPEEFVSVQYAVSTVDPFSTNKADPSVDFSIMPIDQFVQWAKTQTGEYWDCSRDWWRFAEADIEPAVDLLHGASDRETWPVPPWSKVLEVLTAREEKKETVGDALRHKIVDLLPAMPAEKLAELGIPAARWLREVRPKLDEDSRRTVWRSIWDASLTDKDDPEYELDVTAALNHAGGILGEVLWEELVEYVPKVSVGENPGFPERLQTDFERIAEEDCPSGKLARVSLVPRLIWLYRIDPDWTERTFFRRMDPNDKQAFELYLWQGYFWYPQCTADLLAAFKTLFLEILENLDQLPESHWRSNGVALFIDLAVPLDCGIDTGEAKGVLWNVGIDGLEDAARRLRDMLDGAGEKSVALWRDTVDPWFKAVWPRRPKDRSPALSRELAWMAMEAGDAFPHVVATIEDILTPEQYSAALFRLTDKKDLIKRHPDAALTLVSKLVHNGSSLQYLSELLECIAKADPELKESDCFRQLADRIPPLLG